MLYKVKNDRQMNMTISQFIIPESSTLKTKVLDGIHDSAGHQEQAHTALPLQTETLLYRVGE